MKFDEPKKASLSEKAGFALRPRNVLKTIATQVPIVSAAVEVSNQLDSMELDRRLVALEMAREGEATLSERAAEPNHDDRKEVSDWPTAISNFASRIVTIAISYDGANESQSRQGRELIQPVAQACMIDRKRIITCREALELAKEVAQVKRGKIVLVIGWGFHDATFEEPHIGSSLVVGTIGDRDKEKWEKMRIHGLAEDLEDFVHRIPSTLVPHSIRPLVGEECGFLYPGEAPDVMRFNHQYEHTQFDTFTISHFRKPKDHSLISFVSGVLPSRLLQCGSPIFNRQGLLLGILNDTESYESDAGRRAVVLGLLGHPAFPCNRTANCS